MKYPVYSEIPALERRGIAPHRGDVTTMWAANRLKASAAEGAVTGRQREPPPVTAREAPQDGRPRQVLL